MYFLSSIVLPSSAREKPGAAAAVSARCTADRGCRPRGCLTYVLVPATWLRLAATRLEHGLAASTAWRRARHSGGTAPSAAWAHAR
eukprot:5440218-Prymnesium_polylepis.1